MICLAKLFEVGGHTHHADILDLLQPFTAIGQHGVTTPDTEREMSRLLACAACARGHKVAPTAIAERASPVLIKKSRRPTCFGSEVGSSAWLILWLFLRRRPACDQSESGDPAWGRQFSD
jgi:hypothetical protein